MDTISEMCELLDKQKTLLLKYEAATQAILDSGVDDVEKYITERGRLATEVDELRERMESLCARHENGVMLMDCAMNRVEFGRAPAEYQSVFYAGQGVRSVVYRITQTDEQALAHLHKLQETALDNIKQSQNVAKIKKYLDTSMGEGTTQVSLRNEKV